MHSIEEPYDTVASAITVLLAPSNVAAEKFFVSSVAGPEQVAVTHNEGNDRRLLRGHETTDDDEERISNTKILALVNRNDRGIFEHWKGKGYISSTIGGKLSKYKHGLNDKQLSGIVSRYKAFFEVLGIKKTLHFDFSVPKRFVLRFRDSMVLVGQLSLDSVAPAATTGHPSPPSSAPRHLMGKTISAVRALGERTYSVQGGESVQRPDSELGCAAQERSAVSEGHRACVQGGQHPALRAHPWSWSTTTAAAERQLLREEDQQAVA
ncbi:hypothetical protein ON010_g5848 [Phytophthora cinnamomi]|nr:hypothetical protein ON010_g5848 [Phytophthora cinnamomi]